MLRLQAGRLDLEEGDFYRDDGGVERLTDLERRLLRHLADRMGRAVDRDELQREVWGYREGILSRTVFTTVGRVRAKIERDPTRPAHLLTVAGEGYALVVGGVAPTRSPLPTAPGPLLGREAELATAEALLDQGARLLSLLGPGGIGKTRLALEIARRRGAAFAALEPVEKLDRVPHAVAAACGLSLAGHDPWGELAGLDLPALVVLDNAEHLPELGPRLAAWLAGAPLSLIVTSRVRLGLRAEHALLLPPLALPDDAGLAESGAGALVLHQARRARPGWEPAGPDRDALAELCRRVGGNPLALELATAWLRLLEPAEVLAELDAVLRSTDVDLPERHRSMEDTLAASWRLLAPAATRVLEALSVFAEPFDRAGAAAVAGADLLSLGQLVDASMVLRVGRRFDLHPLLRQDARRRLAQDPARRDEVAARHADCCFTQLIAEIDLLDRGGPIPQLPLEDLLAAWADRVRAGDAASLARAGYAFYRHLDLLNRLPDLFAALDLAEAGLPEGPLRGALGWLRAGAGAPRPRQVDFDAVPEPLRSTALIHAAIGVLYLGGDLSEAVALTDRGEAGAVVIDKPFLQDFARSVRASARMRGGDLAGARADLLAAMNRPGDRRAYGRPWVHLGELELMAGDLAAARAHLEGALAACRASDDRSFAAHALGRLGQALAGLGEDPLPLWVEAVEEGVASRLPRVWWATALLGLGEAWGDRDGAVLVAAAAAGPVLDAPERVQATVERVKARVGAGTWHPAAAEGRSAPDALLLALLRRR